MGLGGLTRDSIIGLNNLVHEDNYEAPRHNRRHSNDNLSCSWNDGTNKDSDEFLFLEDNAAALPLSESQASFETSLNDGLSSHATLPVSATPSRRLRSLGYSNASATNSRSLDSYRRNGPVDSSGQSAQAAHYQGFQYDGYADYYSDEYNDDFSYSIGSRGGRKNVLCCLFAPWLQPRVTEAEDVSVMSDPEDDQDNTLTSPENKTGLESSHSASEVEATPTLNPTPMLTGKFPSVKSLGAGSMLTPSPSFERIEETEPSVGVVQAKKKLFVSTTASLPLMNAPAPHMLSDGLDPDSFDTVSSGSIEKEQEEGDVTSAKPADEGEEDDAPFPMKSILKVKRCSVSMGSISCGNSTKDASNETTLSSSDNKRHLFPIYEPKKAHSSDTGRKAIKFNPMARVLTIPSRKDIPLHQKARVWWQKRDYDEFKKTGRIISKAMECGGSEIWLASSKAWGKRTAESHKHKMKESGGDLEEYNKALSKYFSEEEKKEEDYSSIDIPDEKWWCKFGHSRRGLEHIASSSEGKARQQSVLLAIRMVLEEQKRQRVSRTKDPNKLRNVAMQYTSWARDLSLAAALADAEAVSSNFNPTATCRARHFAKRFGTLNRRGSVGGGVAVAITSQILDANTHSTHTTGKFSSRSLKDVNNHLHCLDESLSKRAKGFIPGSRDVYAGELLSGMGNRAALSGRSVSYGI